MAYSTPVGYAGGMPRRPQPDQGEDTEAQRLWELLTTAREHGEEVEQALAPLARAVELGARLQHSVPLRESRRRVPEPAQESTEARAVVASRLREARATAAWTQATLADAMGRLGFPWARITVAEIEGLRRAVSIEELLGLAILFGKPLVSFIIPAAAERIRVGELELRQEEVDELVVGPEGVGSGETSWELPRRLAGVLDELGDWRPAPDYWRAVLRYETDVIYDREALRREPDVSQEQPAAKKGEVGKKRVPGRRR